MHRMSIEDYCAFRGIKIVPDDEWPDQEFIAALKRATAKLDAKYPEES